jgi:hypothetical protein
VVLDTRLTTLLLHRRFARHPLRGALTHGPRRGAHTRSHRAKPLYTPSVAGGRVQVALLGAGDTVGEAAALFLQAERVTYVAASHVTALSISRHQVRCSCARASPPTPLAAKHSLSHYTGGFQNGS